MGPRRSLMYLQEPVPSPGLNQAPCSFKTNFNMIQPFTLTRGLVHSGFSTERLYAVTSLVSGMCHVHLSTHDLIILIMHGEECIT
jgi:hypothetical protein